MSPWDKDYIEKKLEEGKKKKRVIIALIIFLWVIVIALYVFTPPAEGTEYSNSVMVEAMFFNQEEYSTCGVCHRKKKMHMIINEENCNSCHNGVFSSWDLVPTAISKPKAPVIKENEDTRIILENDNEITWMVDYVKFGVMCVYSYGKSTGNTSMSCFTYNNISFETRQMFDK